MAVDTGNGTTCALTTGSAFVPLITSIDVGEQTLGEIDASHLGTTGYMEKVKQDLIDAGSVTINFLADSTDSDKFAPPIGAAAADTLTITLPEQVDANNAATIAGTGFISSWKPPEFVNNELQRGSFTFTWDGYTGPTFTEDAA